MTATSNRDRDSKQGGRKMTQAYNKAENENLICGPDQDKMKALKKERVGLGRDIN